jgi:hypothetical protein
MQTTGGMATIRNPALIALATAGLIGCSAPAEPVEEAVQPIVNGFALSESGSQYFGLAAVFHPAAGGGWYPRPCSGRVVRSAGGFSYILTARHCVTTDSMVNGTVVSPSALRVLPRANAGIPNPNPPAEALTPDFVSAMPITSVSAGSRDIAVVRVIASWDGFVQQHGMWLGAPSALTGRDVLSVGYGINVQDPNCDTDLSTVGAGTARYGSPFHIEIASDPLPGGQQGGFYGITNSNQNGQSLICGDSGGPDFVLIGDRWQGISVHSSGVFSPATSTSTSTWVQDTLGGIYLSPASALNLNVVVGSSTFVVSLHDNVTAPSGAVLHYDPATQRINEQSLFRCLTPGNPALMRDACQDLTRQRWSLGIDGRITSVSDGTCLTASGTSVFTSACGSPLPMSQTWGFHPQVRDPASSLYLQCANENQTCSFSGTREVRYGANGSFTYKLLSNGTACNNSVFGDPIPGTVKQCHIGLNGYTFCAQEGGTCSFSGNHVVAYGANGMFLYRNLTNGTGCNNSVFTDPLPGVVKRCFFL